MSGSVKSYTLRMKNAIPSDVALEKEFEFDRLTKIISTSFDLISFPINKDWDEGRGYDLLEEDYVVRQKGNPLVSGFSNWNSAKSTVTWDEPGVYTNPTASTSALCSTQHFDLGNEDIKMDVTNLVNSWLTGGTVNNGLGVAYSREFELMSTDTRSIASFFTNKTNSSFKPFIEVEYHQVINDDREQVTNNRTNRLFLYTFSGNTNVNYYSAGTVTIKDPSGASVITGMTPTQLGKGVYYVDINLPNATRGQRYSDTWEGVTFVPGMDQQDYVQHFKINDNYYLNSSPGINDYTLNLYGIEGNSILTTEENIRVFANLRINYSQKSPAPYYDLKYRIIMNNQDEVIPWTSVNKVIRNKCQEQYFDLDTSWLLNNQTYKIEFRIEELGSKRPLPNKIDFKIQRPF
jgi:hypothetical protein